VVSGLYPPGSTFKIVTATAGLEEGVIDQNTLVEDIGVLTVGPYSYGNWYFSQYGRTEGEINIVKAIARSNDIFFYKLGEWLQIDRLEDWAHRFYADEIIDTELGGEVAGIIRRDRDWYLGDTYHAAIGQGDVMTTPLHVHTWGQIIANEGKLCTPTLLNKKTPLREVLISGFDWPKQPDFPFIYTVSHTQYSVKNQWGGPEGNRTPEAMNGKSGSGPTRAHSRSSVTNKQEYSQENELKFIKKAYAADDQCIDIGISEKTLDLVQQGMKAACSTGGTAWPLFNFEVTSYQLPVTSAQEEKDNPETGNRKLVTIPIACKTGTAEFGHPDDKTHAWLTAYAPIDNPEIVVTVLLEEGGEGSSHAGPVVKDILTAWFESSSSSIQ